MRTVLAVLALATLALAGCSSKPDLYTCQKTGKVLDLDTIPGSDAKGFDPETACPAPTPPSVLFSKLPASMTAYFPAVFTWTVSPGNYTSGHSMLTQLMWSKNPSSATPQAPATFSTNTPLQTYAHQELPGKFDGKVKFETPGTYYLRAYAQVRGDDLPDGDYWTPEVKVVVSEVNATGVKDVLTHAAGPYVPGASGLFTAEKATVALGDGLVLSNKDFVAHTFSFSGACKHADVEVADGEDSPPITMTVPGSCTVKTDDSAGAQSVAISVTAPA
ncbi:MAG TPA: hypothetical protein VM286_03640 [Candidatus Thermoplasmatota archaeon]|nr:hypothetical protein [Candidatus Thermoplasmatota archaeon]